MIFLPLILWAFVGFSLEIGLELGWAGRPVLGTVNPLWINLRNPEPAGVRAELRVTMEFGSPWRGTGTYTARVPFAVGALAKTRLLLPWPVPAGVFLLRAAAFADTGKLGEGELRFTADPQPLRAGIGPPREPLDLFLSPAEVPSDPLLLSPFTELRVFSPMKAGEEEVVRAWQAFLSGEVGVEGEALRGHLAELWPPAPGWGYLLPGLFLYLVGLGLVLPRWAQGRTGPVFLLLGVFWALALFYSVSREAVPTKASFLLRIERPGFTGFCLELLGISSWVRQDLALPGWWAELLPARDWQGRHLTWQLTGEAWQTALSLEPGVPRLLFRLVREAPLAGQPAPAPHWLLRSLVLPWEQATVLRANAETFVIRLR